MGSKKEEVGRHCPYCGAMVAYGEYFCRACHRKFTDLAELDAPSRQQPDTYVVAVRDPAISAILSATGPGLGQFYNGDTVRGLAFLFAFIAISFNLIVTPYQTVLYYVIWVAATGEALYSASCINHYERPFAGVSYLLYALLAIYGLILALFFLTGQPDLAYLTRVFPVVHLVFG